ncbi:hypothetical protein EUTSA_v10003730mg [Eutrema salsugineum]|uniref:Uncharacterized protein n=1 Tax=Eutrema salsugineum TaxID=72664 RepID=V4K6I6_EUTSA|nr:hypothetical protein EUTSA_v10003730mg [Eutrema salsugineum]
MGMDQGYVFVAKERFFSKILKILVQPISNLGAHKCSSSMEFGYVMVYTLYSIHWYCVKYDESRGRPVLSYLGPKLFKCCSIASASWSPHFPGECLVLLENGNVFVFDLNQRQFRGCKMKISWEYQGKSANHSWLGCEFGWRCGIFIVARSDAVFVITRSSGNCSVRSLLEIKNLNIAETEEFVAFSKAGSDSFRFVLASQSYLFLCDERSQVPLLKWQHDIEKPCFMDVYSLSDLGCETYDSTNFCVVVGSFWNAQSQMFCYGPTKDPYSLHVWELPHNLLLPAGKCLCGDCVVRQVIMKESLPAWIDWQKKRVLILGYGVLNKYLPLGSSSDQATLIRLTSSGMLEAVNFRASRDSLNSLEEIAHIDSACKSDEVNLLYFLDDGRYKFPRRFKYLELDYLSAHTKGTLARFLDSRMSKKASDSKESDSFNLAYHEDLCEKLKICGFSRDKCYSSITAVFECINSQTSVFEIAVKETWSMLRMELLMLAFSNYSEFEGVLIDKKKPSLEFLVVPETPQLPPFLLRKPSSRSSKWSKKEQPGPELVGPVLPLPVLLTLNSEEEEYSPDVEFSDRCNQISKAAYEMANSGVDETIISLGDDMWVENYSQQEKKRFIAYSPITKPSDSNKQDQELTTFISKVRHCKDNADGEGSARLEVLDDMCPVEIYFEERNVNFDTKALLTPKTLLSEWQDRSSSYQNFLSQYHLQK